MIKFPAKFPVNDPPNNIEALKKRANWVEGETKELVDTFKEWGVFERSYFMPWKSKYHEGGTGYIDGVEAQDLSNPIGWGVDPNYRFFVSVRYVVDDLKKVQVATVFQRATFCGDLAYAGHHGPHFGGMITAKEGILPNLKEFLANEIITGPGPNYPQYSTFRLFTNPVSEAMSNYKAYGLS